MTLHAFVAYLEYIWRAKGRHGVHSPFVYDLIEHLLLDKGIIKRAYIVDYPSLELRYENLLSRIAAYYNYTSILFLPLDNNGLAKDKAGMLVINETEPKQWLSLFNKYANLLNNESAVVVTDIHKTYVHTTAWKNLCSDQKVKMSIDLYGVGLLLFREEFKERQHFILKY